MKEEILAFLIRKKNDIWTSFFYNNDNDRFFQLTVSKILKIHMQLSPKAGQINITFPISCYWLCYYQFLQKWTLIQYITINIYLTSPILKSLESLDIWEHCAIVSLLLYKERITLGANFVGPVIIMLLKLSQINFFNAITSSLAQSLKWT